MAYRYQLQISKDARIDLEEIVQYISDHLSNPQAATDFMDAVEAVYVDIAQTPQMYAFCNNTILRRMGYRKIPIKNYVMVYRFSEETGSVIIMRFFYGGMDYMKLL